MPLDSLVVVLVLAGPGGGRLAVVKLETREVKLVEGAVADVNAVGTLAFIEEGREADHQVEPDQRPWEDDEEKAEHRDDVGADDERVGDRRTRRQQVVHAHVGAGKEEHRVANEENADWAFGG